MLTIPTGCPVLGLRAGRFVLADWNQNHAATSETREPVRLQIRINTLVSMRFSRLQILLVIDRYGLVRYLVRAWVKASS